MFELVKYVMKWHNLDSVVCDKRQLKRLTHDGVNKDMPPRQAGPSTIPCTNLAL